MQGVEPEARTFNTIIIACNLCGQPLQALEVSSTHCLNLQLQVPCSTAAQHGVNQPCKAEQPTTAHGALLSSKRSSLSSSLSQRWYDT